MSLLAHARGFFGIGISSAEQEHSQSRGIVLLLLGVLSFSLMDAIAKYLAPRYDPVQIVWARYFVNFLVVILLLGRSVGPTYRTRNATVQVLRGFSQLASVGLFFTSLGFIGLAEATAIMDSNPVLITLGAALFLGEPIGWRRIVGIIIALVGAMIIIRPGTGVFQPAAVLPLLGAFTYAAGAILTRKARHDPIATSVLWTATIGTILTSALVGFYWTPIQPGDIWAFIAIGVIGAVAQALIIRAFAVAEASAIAPFGYVGIVFAATWGWLFWGTVPDLWTIIGATIVVAGGIYVWTREARATKKAI